MVRACGIGVCVALASVACEPQPLLVFEAAYACGSNEECAPGYECIFGGCSRVDGGAEVHASDGGRDAGRVVAGIAQLDGGLQRCSPAGWCWVNPRSFGFQNCQVSMAGPGAGFALLDSTLYRVTSAGIERVVGSGIRYPTALQATGSDSVLVLDATHRDRVYNVVLGRRTKSKVIDSPLTNYQLSLTADGTQWAFDRNAPAAARYEASLNRWVGVSFPESIRFVVNGAWVARDEGYFTTLDTAQFAFHTYHYADGGWAVVNGADDLRCIWGRSSERVYASTRQGIGRLGPNGLSELYPPPPSGGCIGGEVGDDLFAFGQGISAYSHGAWRQVLESPGLRSFSMFGSEGLACTSNALFSTRTGFEWSRLNPTLVDIEGGSGPFDVVIRDDGAAYVLSDTAWLFDEASATPQRALTGMRRMVRLAPSAYLAYGADGFHRFDGAALGAVLPSPVAASQLQVSDVVAEESGGAWAVGSVNGRDASVLYFDGAGWSEVSPPEAIQSIEHVTSREGHTWVSAGDRVYERRDGGWLPLGSSGLGSIASMVALSADSVLVGSPGGIKRWSLDGGWATDSTQWSSALATDPVDGTVLSLGPSADVFERVDGGTWVRSELPGPPGSPAQLAIQGHRAWLAGPAGSVLLRR